VRLDRSRVVIRHDLVLTKPMLWRDPRHCSDGRR
jgi:hypothetical protein